MTLTDFLLARIAEDDQRERDERALRGVPESEWAEALPIMARSTAYKIDELRAAFHQLGWALLTSLWPSHARWRASRYADHPDFRDDWRP